MEFFRKYFCKKETARQDKDNAIKMKSIAGAIMESAESEERESVKHQEKAEMAMRRGLQSDAEIYAKLSAESKIRANEYFHNATQVEAGNANSKAKKMKEQVSKELKKATKVMDSPGEAKRLKKITQRFEKFYACIENGQLHQSTHNMITSPSLGISPSSRPRSQSLCDTLDIQQTFSSAPTLESGEKDDQLDQWYMTPETHE